MRLRRKKGGDMSLPKMLLNICLAAPLLFVLGACGASAPAPVQQPAGVQDINPGDHSMIQPPAARNTRNSAIGEKSI